MSGSGSHVDHPDGEVRDIGPLCTTSGSAWLGAHNVRARKKTDPEVHEDRRLRANLNLTFEQEVDGLPRARDKLGLLREVNILNLVSVRPKLRPILTPRSVQGM